MKELDFGNKIITGEGALAKLEELAGNSTLIITDQSMVKFGMVAKVKELLTHCEISEFDGVMPDPTLNVITAGVKASGWRVGYGYRKGGPNGRIQSPKSRY